MSFRSFLAGSWTFVILALCWLPRSLMPRQETGPRPFFVPNFDKLVHLGIFAVFAFLWMRVGPPAGKAGRIFLAGLALAVISELGQELPIVSRDATVMDAVADVVGVGVGLLAYRMMGQLGQKPKAEVGVGDL
jgi:hypothetical protein